MAKYRLVLAALLLCGCAARAPIHYAAPIKTPESEGLVVPPDRVVQGRAAAEALDARVAKGDCQALADVFRLVPDGGFLAKRQCQGLTGPIHTMLDPLYPIGDGFMADAAVNGVSLGEVYLGPGEGKLWQIATEPPTTADNLVPPVLVAEKADITIVPEKHWVTGDVLATVKGTQSVLEFEFAGYRILEVSQDGKPCRFRAVPGRLLVEPAPLRAERAGLRGEAEPAPLRAERAGLRGEAEPAPLRAERAGLRGEAEPAPLRAERAGEEAGIHIRFEGEPPEHPGAWGEHRSMSLALPRLEHTWAKFEVRAARPAGYSLFGQGEELVGGKDEQSRWLFEGSSFCLMGGTGYNIRRVPIPGVDVTLATFPEQGLVASDRLDDSIRQVFEALKPLGPYPSRWLRVVLTSGGSPRGQISSIAIGEEDLLNPDPVLATLLSFYVAQGWFGGKVPSRQDDSWPVVMALYLSQRSDPGAALHMRQMMSRSYAGMASARDLPILSIHPGVRTLDEEPVLGKAVLMMVALEDKIGSEHLLRELKLFLEARAGQNSNWDDLAEVMRLDIGPDICAWLKDFVRTTGAPHVRMTDVRFEGGFAWANLVIDEGDPRALVEVGFWRKGELVGEGKFALQRFGLVTPIRVPIPPGSEVLVMDPRFRIPRRYDPAADPVKAGFEFPLPRQ